VSAPGTYVRALRTERGLDPEAVAKAAGIGAERQAQIESGEATPSYAERRAYAKVFGFTCVQAFDDGWRASRIPLSRGESFGRIPVINLAPAGRPRDYVEPYADSGIGRAYIDPPPGVSGPDLFAFVIDGDSMEPDYPQGHYAICRPAKPEQIAEGQAVLVRFDESRDFECTFKCCYSAGADDLELRPINRKHASLIVPKVQIVRMSPVIAVVSPERAEPSQRDHGHRLVGEDVQHEPAETESDRRI
jgi:transcriptional regulator with XRE-family HTH domain